MSYESRRARLFRSGQKALAQRGPSIHDGSDATIRLRRRPGQQFHPAALFRRDDGAVRSQRRRSRASPGARVLLQAPRILARRDGPRHAVRDQRLSRDGQPRRAAGRDRLSVGAGAARLSRALGHARPDRLRSGPGADRAAARRLFCVVAGLGLLLQVRDADRRRALHTARCVRDGSVEEPVQRLSVDDAGRGADVPLSRSEPGLCSRSRPGCA